MHFTVLEVKSKSSFFFKENKCPISFVWMAGRTLAETKCACTALEDFASHLVVFRQVTGGIAGSNSVTGRVWGPPTVNGTPVSDNSVGNLYVSVAHCRSPSLFTSHFLRESQSHLGVGRISVVVLAGTPKV